MATSSDTASRAAGPLDVSNLVNQLIAEESKSRLAPLVSKAEELHALICAYGALRLVLATGQMALQDRDAARFSAHKNVLSNDADDLLRAVSGIVNSVNTLTRGMFALTWPAPSAGRGNTMIQALAEKLRDCMLAAASGHANCPLATIGLHFSEDATIALDSDRLNAVADRNPEDLAALFWGQDGLIPRLLSLLNQLLDENGPLAGQTRQLQISLKTISDQQAAVQERLACLRESYTSQFNRLNITLEKMQASQNQPGQQRRPLR